MTPPAAFFMLMMVASKDNGLANGVENTSDGIASEELVNGCTHGGGLVLSSTGLVVLLILAARYGTA
jgi:predicted membrane channel-forming protein YqfA (hemolysin III family)